MTIRKTNILFVSKDNAVRSLLAEACLRHVGGDRFRAFSCGQTGIANGKPNPWTLLTLTTLGISNDGLRCKDWSEFSASGSLRMDYVVALDAGTQSEHPRWPGQPATALWDYAPAEVLSGGNSAPGLAVVKTVHSLRRRLELLVGLHAKISRRSELLHDLRDLAYD